MRSQRTLLAALTVGVVVAFAGCGSGETAPRATSRTQLERTITEAAELFGAELDRFWASTFPTFAAGRYRPPSRLVPYDRGTVPDLGCGIRDDPPRKWTRNAVYCRQDEAIAYEVQLLGEKAKRFGLLPALLVLAHEWGHHIQHLDGQLRNTSLPIELGADCYFGIFAAHVDERHLFGKELGDAAGTLQTAAAAAFFSGHRYERWFDRGVHGTPRERVIAFRVGVLTEDAQYCRGYARYRPLDPLLLGGYSLESPAGARAAYAPGRLTLQFGRVRASVVPVPALPGTPAERQIDGVLSGWFRDRAWRRQGDLGESGLDENLGGTRAVQPYTLEEPGGPAYGAVALHVREAGGGLLVDVSTPGRLEAVGGDPFEPIGDFLYSILANVCAPETEDVVCTQPLGDQAPRRN